MGNCGCGNSTPCGCKSGGTAIVPAGGCSCGGGGCAVCEPRAYLRPRFFAGQLLTDQDLSLLEEYVVAKNRLHNRALWGEGVVCGLDVTCDPCGGANIVVQPGYAINCCGDDVVVPCPEKVDVLALLRDLRRGMLNADCSDPCDQPAATPPPSTGATDTGSRAPVPPATAPMRQYFLYVRYAEDLTDPVSPYATDEPCAGQACEPTRVREGHVYELRCERTPRPLVRMGDVWAKCGLDEPASRLLDQIAALFVEAAERVDTALRALPANDAPLFAAGDFFTLSNATATLNAAMAAIPAPGEGGDTSSFVSAAVDGVRQTGSLLARLGQTPAALRPQSDNSEVIVRRAVDALGAALAQLPQMLGNGDAPPARVTNSEETLALARRWVGGQAPADGAGFSDALFAYGGVLTERLGDAFLAADTALAAYLAPRLQPSAHTASCTLATQGQKLTSLPKGPYTRLSSQAFVLAAMLRGQLVVATRQECICGAFNPPCVSCDDPGVLLATLCVSNCMVVDICNNVRSWVISPKALRYWIGFPTQKLGNFLGVTADISAMGSKVEESCCGARPFGCPPGQASEQVTDGGFTRMFSSAEAAPQPSAPTAPPVTVPPSDTVINQRINAAVATALAPTMREIENLRTQIEALRQPGTPGVG